MERLENKMVIDWAWEADNTTDTTPPEKGYYKFGGSEFVPEENAYEYALEHSLNGTAEEQRDFKDMLIEWFFSGGWIRR